MSVLCVAIFWIVNASSGKKICLQFSMPIESGAGVEGGVLHRLTVMCRTFSECLNPPRAPLKLSLLHSIVERRCNTSP